MLTPVFASTYADNLGPRRGLNTRPDPTGRKSTELACSPALDADAAQRVMRRLHDEASGEAPVPALCAQEKRVLDLIGDSRTNREK